MEKTLRLSKRFYIVSLIAAVVVVGLVVGLVVLLTKMSGNIKRMRSTTIYSEIESAAIVIRDETVVTVAANEYKILCNEGDAITNGMELAELYPYNYQTQADRICTAETELYQRMESMLLSTYGGTLPENIRAYSDAIELLSKSLRQIASGESTGSYSDTETQLLAVLSARREAMLLALGDTATLAESLDALQRMYDSYYGNTVTKHLSAYNGYISFFTDSNEETLKDVRELTVSQVKRILSSTSVSVPEDGLTYRVVTDRGKFYIAFVIDDESDLRLMPFLTYTFLVRGIDHAFQGTVVSENDQQNGVLYVMEVHSDVSELLTMRVVDICIQNNASGLYVPKEYLEYRAGVPYLTIKTQYGYQAIPVYIAASDGEDVIVAAREEGLSLFAGLKYRMPIETEEEE